MSENLKKFLEVVTQNEELCAKLNGMSKDAIMAAAKAVGIELTEADLAQNAELNDTELDAVAGGGACACVFGGGGKEDSNDGLCVCAAYGYGVDNDDNKRCICPAVGGGTNS